MLNYIALSWVQFWVFGPWSEGGFQQTDAVPARGLAAAPDRLRDAVPGLGGLTVHLGLIFGIVAATIMWVALERTRWGYEIRLIGDSPRGRALRRHRHRNARSSSSSASRARSPAWAA